MGDGEGTNEWSTGNGDADSIDGSARQVVIDYGAVAMGLRLGRVFPLRGVRFRGGRHLLAAAVHFAANLTRLCVVALPPPCPPSVGEATDTPSEPVFSDVAALADLAQRLRVLHQPLASHLPSLIEQVDHFRTGTDSITVANQPCASPSSLPAPDPVRSLPSRSHVVDEEVVVVDASFQRHRRYHFPPPPSSPVVSAFAFASGLDCWLPPSPRPPPSPPEPSP
ncbi:hypothetical protein PF005_g20493 [Phytophthora fragariae]|uniref:Uncharacterized protein n=1 Tax=Phytophthora fragariae TaxID=53985 RepID=A0A6A3E4E8_9STRA|nr:hypothetical protein PF009_g21405 [Phytophthora fragariae]KAE9187332.1 hypothetical protein PF005_g20493 [Phytophthora fragariae]KAE9199541.1 hypothetical protein PF004_g19245 [Phytophthora fragariae]